MCGFCSSLGKAVVGRWSLSSAYETQTAMKSFILLILALHMPKLANASPPLGQRDRAAIFVIREETDDFALEAREDVCVEFAENSNLNGPAILTALHDKGLKFHDESWCNARPRGVMISIDAKAGVESSPSKYEFVSQVDDSDPIRLYGNHFATLLRKSKYVVLCENGSAPVLVSYQRLCCEKESKAAGASAH
jgi:hypothetical protein